MRLIFAIPIFLVYGCYVTTVVGNHLPEDSKLRDDGVALVREKRDNFIDRILKSIPFFHMSSPVNALDEEQVEPFNDDDDDAADDDDDDDGTTPSVSPMPLSSSFAPVRSSMILSATVPVTSTPWSDQSRQSVVMSTDSVVSIASSPLPPSTAAMIQTTPAIMNSVVMTSSEVNMGEMSTGELLDSFMSVNAAKDTMLNFSFAPSASIATVMSVSGVMATARSSIATTVSATTDDTEPVIKMMIMSGEPALRVQDYGSSERGFVEGLGRQGVGEDIDVKNIRFMYASVLVPVMSGLVGALLITFGILIFKCVKRRRLKKVRYYGAKPGSGLYRLDQIGLLSDMSSDEE